MAAGPRPGRLVSTWDPHPLQHTVPVRSMPSPIERSWHVVVTRNTKQRRDTLAALAAAHQVQQFQPSAGIYVSIVPGERRIVVQQCLCRVVVRLNACSCVQESYVGGCREQQLCSHTVLYTVLTPAKQTSDSVHSRPEPLHGPVSSV